MKDVREMTQGEIENTLQDKFTEAFDFAAEVEKNTEYNPLIVAFAGLDLGGNSIKYLHNSMIGSAIDLAYLVSNEKDFEDVLMLARMIGDFRHKKSQ